MIFWKSGFAGNYYRRTNFKSRYLKNTKGTFIWTPYMLGTWNFACTFPVWRSTNLIDGFWKFYFLAVLWAKNGKNPRWPPFFGSFSPIKCQKSKISKIHQSDLWNYWQGRYMQNFRFLACMVSKWMYLLYSMRNRDLKFAPIVITHEPRFSKINCACYE